MERDSPHGIRIRSHVHTALFEWDHHMFVTSVGHTDSAKNGVPVLKTSLEVKDVLVFYHWNLQAVQISHTHYLNSFETIGYEFLWSDRVNPVQQILSARGDDQSSMPSKFEHNIDTW